MPDLSALRELDASLREQGLEINAASVASAFLGLARQKGWTNAAPRVGLDWLGDLACEVLKQKHPVSPLLDELRERLEVNAVIADPRKIAAAVLGIALEARWHDQLGRMMVWLEQLAVDVVQD